jgi:hypothetical protein
VGGKLALVVVLVISLGRLAAGASSSSVSSSESVVLGLRPSRLLGPSSLGVLWLYLHLLFLVDVVSGDMDLLLCEHKIWIGAWHSRLSQQCARWGVCPRRVLLVCVHSSKEARASLCVIALWRPTHFSFLMPLYCKL